MTTFAVLLFAYTLSQFYRSFLAVVAGDLVRDLGLGPGDLGALSAIWFVAFALAQLPIGYALDRLGPRVTLSCVMMLAAAGALGLAGASGYGRALGAMALIGAGCAPVLMAGMVLFARTYPPGRFAFLSTILIGLSSLGNVLGATPLAWAAERWGWRASMVAIAGLTAAAAALAAALLRDPPPAAGEEPASSFLGGLAAILRIRALWPLLPLTALSYAVVIAARALWIGPYLGSVHGFATDGIGQAALAMALAMSFGALAYGPAERRLGAKGATALGSCATVAAFLALAAFGSGDAALAVALLTAIGGFGMTYAILMAHGRAFMPPALVGRGVTLLNFCFIGGAGIVQWLSGRFVQASGEVGMSPETTFGRLFAAFGIALAAATAIYAFAPPRPPASFPGRARLDGEGV